MPRKKSRNPAAILSVSLPLSTRNKIDNFNPRNRSKFFNEAVLQFINKNDPAMVEKTMELEEELNLENPRIEQASANRLVSVLLRSNLIEEYNTGNVNPKRVIELYNLLSQLKESPQWIVNE